MNERCAIGVDMGGQSVKLALVDDTGLIHLRQQAPMNPTLSADAIAALLIQQVEQLHSTAKIKGFSPTAAGIVMPGYMDVGRTKLLFAANLPTLSGSDFLSTVKTGIDDMQVAFDADCNAAAFGEYHFGAGRGIDRLIVVTVGTGIGGAVMVQGRILRLWNHISGSLGHVIVNAKGLRCNCGARGCVETQASGPALEKLATELAAAEPDSLLAQYLAQHGRLTGHDIRMAMNQGDAPAQRVVRECGWWLGAAVASWSVIYAPNMVLIGGGIAALGEPLLNAIREGLRDVGQPHTTRHVRVDAAALGPDAGVVGAAAMVMPHVEENGSDLE